MTQSTKALCLAANASHSLVSSSIAGPKSVITVCGIPVLFSEAVPAGVAVVLGKELLPDCLHTRIEAIR